jgi:hypothetical protein
LIPQLRFCESSQDFCASSPTMRRIKGAPELNGAGPEQETMRTSE